MSATSTSGIVLTDVSVGDALPELAIAVTPTTVVLGAIASRDWRPMHHDYKFATERNGVADIFLNTPNQAAWFERYVTDWTGPSGRLGRMKFRMKDSIFPGDTMTFAATVTDVTTDDVGCGWVSLEVTLTATGPTKGEPVTCSTCTVRVAVPTDPDDNPWSRRRRPVATLRERDPMLDLDFTDEQNMLREMVRGMCEQYADLDVIRAMEDDAVGYPTAMWAQLAELGILGMTIPELHGGSGMTMQEGVVVYEELGRALAPLPHLVSCVVSAGALLAGGDATQIDAWVPQIAAGEAILTPAWLEPDNGFGPKGVQVQAVPAGDGFTITGTKQHVYFASSAQHLVVLARTGTGDTDIDLFLVDPAAAGVTLTQKMSISSDTQYRVDFEGVAVAASDRIGAAGSGWATWQKVMDDAMTLQAAYANGGCDHALEITVQYSKDREQFDKPLGAFQALSHNMADAKTALDGSKVLNYEAAWAHSLGRPVTKLAAMSKLFACNTYRDTTAMAQQIFGGVGFTLEYEIQLYFRRAKQQQITWNDKRRCEDLVAAAVLDEPAA